MPRELELLTVYRTHARPQFVEDALRDLLRAVHQRIRSVDPAAAITIRATSMESIHDFDISGEITCSVAELDQMFPS